MHPQDPAGGARRHWLAGRITGDCPRCGWHGYCPHDLATIGGDWNAAVCATCPAGLHPAITVAVRDFPGSLAPGRGARRGDPPAHPQRSCVP